MCTRGNPLDVLRQVREGIDIVQSSYAAELSLDGLAAVFPLGIEPPLAVGAGGDASSESSDRTTCCRLGDVLNLRDASCRLDQRPLVEGCPCYTCRQHTRAYLYHLLDRHEMLAPTLLQLHNVWHMNAMLARVREEIEKGTFEEYCMLKLGPANTLPEEPSPLTGTGDGGDAME